MAGECAQCSEYLTGNLLPILHELRHALQQLQRGDGGTVIDLRAMPFAPGELDQLEAQLGRGEISARLEALGPTDIYETAVAGVWLVTHYNSDESVIGKFIEVDFIPALLKSQPEDIEQGIATLSELIDSDA